MVTKEDLFKTLRRKSEEKGVQHIKHGHVCRFIRWGGSFSCYLLECLACGEVLAVSGDPPTREEEGEIYDLRTGYVYKKDKSCQVERSSSQVN